MLSRLFAVRGTVVKRREAFPVGRTRVHLDSVEKLGCFVELEVVLADGESAEDGRCEAGELQEALGISETPLIAGAYIDLLEEAAVRKGSRRTGGSEDVPTAARYSPPTPELGDTCLPACGELLLCEVSVELPTAPGVVFDRATGRLYEVATGQVMVLFPWPEMIAHRCPVERRDWRFCLPAFRLPVDPGGQDDPVRRYATLIPTYVRQAVTPYTRDQWQLLSWIARSGPAALDLCLSNPALAFMVASAWQFRRRSGREACESAPPLLPYRKQRSILGWLGSPATEAARREVRKITYPAMNVDWLLALRQRLKVAEIAKRLAIVPRVNAAILRMTAVSDQPPARPRIVRRRSRAP
jgi:hypothetical protein